MKKNITQGISMSPQLLAQAVHAADEEHRSLSNYIQKLITDDLNARKGLVRDKHAELKDVLKAPGDVDPQS